MEQRKASAELAASGFGWPEGPTVLPGGRLVFVESYRSQLTVVDADGAPRQFAYVAGAPNSCVLGADGDVYLCQNGGTCGPWRAAEMTVPFDPARARGRRRPKFCSPKSRASRSTDPTISSSPQTAGSSSPIPGPIIREIPTRAIFSASRRTARRKSSSPFPSRSFRTDSRSRRTASIVWDESYTGHVRRLRPDGSIEDLGRMPGDNPGARRHENRRGRAPLCDRSRRRRPACARARRRRSKAFIPCGKAPTNCAFDGETL